MVPGIIPFAILLVICVDAMIPFRFVCKTTFPVMLYFIAFIAAQYAYNIPFPSFLAISGTVQREISYHVKAYRAKSVLFQIVVYGFLKHKFLQFTLVTILVTVFKY